MRDAIWYVGFPVFAVSVFGAPYKGHYDDYDKYKSDQYDAVYDQRQNGSENYRINVDGLSLVWSPNSLLAAAALLEPALYGEYPDANIDVLFGETDVNGISKPSVSKPPPGGDTSQADERPNKLGETKPSEHKEPLMPTILVIDGQKPPTSAENSTISARRKLRIPGLLRPFLRNRSSLAVEPSLKV